MHWAKNNRSTLLAYLAMVIVPLVVVLLYLLLFAQGRYLTDATVVVKQVGEVSTEASTGIGALLGVSSTSTEDSQYLKAFIQSRDLVEKLDKKLDLQKEFQGSGSDPIFELPASASKEELVAYYNKRVKVDLDEQTNLLHLSVEGFSPSFALRLNQEILAESEQFVNDISQEVAKDQLVFATDQLNEALENLTQSREALISYQNKNQMFDPQAQAQAVAQIVNQLESNLAQLRTEERTLLSYLNPTAPQVVALRSQIQSVEKQIQDEKSKLTSPGNAEKLNRSAADFESLKAQVEFNTDLYKLALASLEKARLEAVRKLKNLVVITSPRLAQEALYPRVGYIAFSAFLLLNLFFGIVMLVRSVIREHKE
ncbi:capsular polysaccharide transport system permease protein [Acinetobacter marinus]|uniref:Capsular polysaccharide transport system permease protein n=1 Tax=Acinetobacter marinus TaxID=281375 RepID=A0A1G6L0B8_9GAMM|nr:capsule biosynthesis protein [Acinetobacter marinus]SDC36531.1 capsular polysaccharide transport system permease protein [Acinetobacter marinus]